MRNRIFFIVASLSLATIFSYCDDIEKTSSGETLAKRYCSNCHLFPEPEILDHTTWEKYILPRMGAFLGFYTDELPRASFIEDHDGGKIVEEAAIFPQKPSIKNKDWQAIKSYYLENAPDQLTLPAKLSLDTSRSLFNIKFPDLYLSPPSTTYLNIDSNRIQFADANKQLFFEVDQNSKPIHQIKSGEGLVHVEEMDSSFFLTVMGSFSPTDLPNGYILQVFKNKNIPSKKIIPKLHRPVHSNYTDINNDGLTDIIISEFGKWTGKLSLFLQQPNQSYKAQILINRSGAIKSEIYDFDQDGDLDILALFGQGDEGFLFFENQGDNNFQARNIIQFHPSMGSSYFTLHDYNEDGKQDILYTAGDNADYNPILKPYHGIYIFLQKQNLAFEQSVFIPFDGAYKVIPNDFDQDGDIDLAAISFFPDFSATESSGFSLFINQNNTFHQQTNILSEKTGRWITMDGGDIDQDGDIDLVLGAFTFEAPSHPVLVKEWVRNGLPFVILENSSK